MDYGSSHVWVYDDSDEEFMSDTELQEGMWLSLSEGEDDLPTLAPQISNQPSKQQQTSQTLINPEQEVEGSTTKYLPENSSSDSSDEDDKPPATKAKSRKYVEVEHLHIHTKQDEDESEDELEEQPVRHKPNRSSKHRMVGDDSHTVEYAKVKHAKKPVVRVHKPQVPSPPHPLPPPPRGIIRNKLAAARVKRLKKQRVRWERSDSNEGSRGRQTRRADTNVLAVKFNTLTEPSNVHTGDAVVCCNPNCTSILSHLSKLTDHIDPDRDEKIWLCEFCGTQNEVDIVPEEIPTKEDTTFIIAPVPVAQGVTGGATAGVEDALVIFCIDISGSMCVTTEVPGKFQLKGHERIQKLSSLNVQNEDQYMPRQRRDVTYVSRLQSVQAAVDHQLTQLSSSFPSQKVAIVTFGDEVTVIGNARSETFTLAGDKLSDSEAVVKIGDELPLPAPIKDTRKLLSKKLFELEEGGQTALGPALLLSISLAGRVPGSKVVICTDGLANKGVGNLDDLRSDEAQAEAQTFYEDMGTLAVDNGVTVSLVRLKGTDCKALELGQVADKTGGQVTTVDPLNITREFSSILANPVIATQVTTKIVLHSELYFRTEESKESLLTIPVGNVTATTELTYEYGVRSKKSRQKQKSEQSKASASPEQKRVPPLKVDDKDCLPFQLQIEYTGQDGSTNIRVITQAKPITRDRNIAEKDIDMAVVGTHVAHRTANLAMQGEYTQARISALSNQRLLQRTSHTSSENRCVYRNVMEDLIPLENELCRKQEVERAQFGRNYSDDEDEERFFYERNSELMGTALAQRRTQSEGVRQTHVSALASNDRRAASVQQKAPIPKAKKKKAISRRRDIDDDLATYMYNITSTKSDDYDLPFDARDESPK